MKLPFIIAILLTLAAGCTHRSGGDGSGAGRATIRPDQLADKAVWILETDAYRAVLAPELARFPLSLINKTTGNELFAQPVSPATPNTGFQPFGGIVDCLPWVSGRLAGQRLADKGLLFQVPWTVQTGTTRDTAWFEGQARIEYEDLLDGTTSRLLYIKRITGRNGSPDLVMEQVIRNTGTTAARFMMTLHGRTAIAGYTAGDYLYVPGERALISYMNHPELAARGITPPQTVDWPFPEAVSFQPGPEPRHVFVFTPADWAVAGSETTGDALLVRGGEVTTPAGKGTVKMALFMTNTQYLLEPGLTACIEATETTWADPDNTIRLEPGQACSFSVTLTLLSGVGRANWPEAYSSFRKSNLAW